MYEWVNLYNSTSYLHGNSQLSYSVSVMVRGEEGRGCCYCNAQTIGIGAKATLFLTLVHLYISLRCMVKTNSEVRVICYQLSSENNLPTFQLNAPVVITFGLMMTGAFS